jgi:hypothetical protein
MACPRKSGSNTKALAHHGCRRPDYTGIGIDTGGKNKSGIDFILSY